MKVHLIDTSFISHYIDGELNDSPPDSECGIDGWKMSEVLYTDHMTSDLSEVTCKRCIAAAKKRTKSGDWNIKNYDKQNEHKKQNTD